MKFTRLVVFIAVVAVVLVSFAAPIKARVLENSTQPPCTTIEITGCQGAILYGEKPTAECCGKLKEQEPCFCDFIKTPAFQRFVTSPKARAILAACNIPYPTC